MKRAVLDTDMVSEVFRQKHPVVMGHARAYERDHGPHCFSEYVRFERRRDLIAKGATIQIALFDLFCTESAIFPVDREVFDGATDLWAIATINGIHEAMRI